MPNATKKILEVLKERGYRVTKARAHIVTALAGQSQPVSIQELAAAVSDDEASVYRTIAMLQKEELVEEIRTPGQKNRFALAHEHHHHVACTGCGLIAHIPCEAVVPLKQLPQAFQTVTDHEVTFYGRCKNCAPRHT